MEKNKIITRSAYATGVHVREKEDGSESREITGYAILFNTRSVPLWEDDEEVAYEQIAPEAITKEVLDNSDIKMTMFHDRQLILARSNKASGTLTYNVDEHGVSFSFEAPHTIDGDKALELVKRGDICGCSFAFSCPYWNGDYVERRAASIEDGKVVVEYIVRKVEGIHDFTLAADPAYPDTNCEVREMEKELKKREEPEPTPEPKPEPYKPDAAMLARMKAQMARTRNIDD